MKLENLIKSIHPISVIGNTDVQIALLTQDSREAKTGSLFIALKGTKNDGHKFIEKAIAQKVTAILYDAEIQIPKTKTTFIKVENSAKALGIIASTFYGNPSEKLKLIGITGTNGKTTTATLLYKLFQDLGFKTGLISTIKNYIGEQPLSTKLTTPDAITLNQLLAQMAEAGCQYCFAEISSHAIAQHRIAGLSFSGGIFSNLTHDHLDYHNTFSEYLKAKQTFFDNLPKNAFALTNTDDRNGEIMLQNTKAAKHSYGLKSAAEFHAKVLETHFEGTLLNLCGREIWSLLIGEFNAYNVLAAYATASLLGIDTEKCLAGISALQAAAGRFQTISKNGKIAVVDYAHTPDALKNVITAINKIRNKSTNLITVCGAGGNRDKTKRPEMAAIASQQSTKTILTSDNPRDENPEQIIEDMYAGVQPENKPKVLKITNRKEAIRTAVMLAQKGDIILIAGKGHENYQEINGVREPFDDAEVVKGIMK